MKVPYVLGVLAFTFSPAFASTIAPHQAVSYQGSNVVVEGPAIVRRADDPHNGVEISLTDGNMSLGAYIPRDQVEKFPDLNVLDGKLVDVSGVVEMNSGRPEIRVNSPDQIRIVR